MKKILKLTFILFLVCAITAGILGVVNEITYQRIETQQREKTERAYAAVLASDGYEDVPFDKEAFPTVDSISRCTNGAGWVVTTTFSGAQGSITMAVGVDTDYKCTGISIIKHSETSGLGANAASSSEKGVTWRAQFVGEDENVAITKMGGDIDALAGATITSRSVAGATGVAIRAAKSLG